MSDEQADKVDLPAEAQALSGEIEVAFLSGRYDDAIKVAYEGLKRPWDLNNRSQATAFLCFTHWLIDAGAGGRRRAAVEDGLARLCGNTGTLSRWFTKVSNEYNLGNAYSALFQIDSFQRGYARRLSTVAVTKGCWSRLKSSSELSSRCSSSSTSA